MSNQETVSQEYQVWVDDNEHYMDRSARYSAGTFQDCASAIAKCKYIVDQFLLSSYREGMTAKHLMRTYQFYGEDPWVSSADDDCKFSAWTYAAERCMEICGPITEEEADERRKAADPLPLNELSQLFARLQKAEADLELAKNIAHTLEGIVEGYGAGGEIVEQMREAQRERERLKGEIAEIRTKLGWQ